MATYLKAQSEQNAPAAPADSGPPEGQTAAMMETGAKVYRTIARPAIRTRRGRAADLSAAGQQRSDRDAQPGQRHPHRRQRRLPAQHPRQPAPYGMPPFHQDLSDEQVAAVVTYIRQSWGNNATPTWPARGRALAQRAGGLRPWPLPRTAALADRCTRISAGGVVSALEDRLQVDLSVAASSFRLLSMWSRCSSISFSARAASRLAMASMICECSSARQLVDVGAS